MLAASNAKIQLRPVRRNISVLQGSVGNIAVLSGAGGKLVVDAGYTACRPQIASALAPLGSTPVKLLINAHWHTDHMDGNAWLHEAGATIIAHENTRKRMAVPTRVEGWETGILFFKEMGTSSSRLSTPKD